MKKPILPLLLALCLALSLLPAAALATDGETSEVPVPLASETAEAPADEAVAAVQALIDALPSAASVTAEDYNSVQAAYEAYEALTAEQQSAVTGAEAFEALFVWFNNQTSIIPLGNDGDTGSTHSHPICGGSSCTCGSSHSNVTWTGISSLSEISNYSSDTTTHYYLTQNVTLTANTTNPIGRAVFLCLNGHTITGADGEAVINIDNGGTLTLTDCATTPGKITHTSASGTGVSVSGTFNMYGGTITGNKGGVEVTPAHSGTSATFNMYGGTITGNSTKYGAGVCVNSSNNATNAFFNMYKGSITENTASSLGGGVYVNSGATFTMSGGSITGNSAVAGGGVNIDDGTFTMSGGSITGNTANTGGGVQNAGTFNLSGSPNISGNKTATTNGSDSNVYLYGTNTITITGELSNSTKIGVSSGGNGQSIVLITDTSNYLSGSASRYFTSDNSSYTLSDDGKLVEDIYSISLNKSGTHTFTAATVGDTTAPDALTVTVTNTGNKPTGKLTVSLSGTNSSDFTLSSSTIDSIANNGGTASFTVTPNTGLAAGTHTATITVTGNNSISASFTVSFTVKEAPTYSISLSPNPLDLGTATEGYTNSQYNKKVTITNTGNQNITNSALTMSLGGTDSDKFVLNGSQSSLSCNKIDAGASISYIVEPKSDLAAGTYEATITVKNSDESINASIPVTFTVSKANDDPAPSTQPSTQPSAAPSEAPASSAAPGATPAPTAKADKAAPKTGDEAALALWLILATAAATGIAIVARKKAK